METTCNFVCPCLMRYRNRSNGEGDSSSIKIGPQWKKHNQENNSKFLASWIKTCHVTQVTLEHLSFVNPCIFVSIQNS